MLISDSNLGSGIGGLSEMLPQMGVVLRDMVGTVRLLKGKEFRMLVFVDDIICVG